MVIDTHTLLWWLEQSPDLSDLACETLNHADKSGLIFYVAAVSFWELYRKEVAGILKPRMSVRQWPGLLGRLDWLELVDITPSIWLEMAELKWPHRDPADRLIATVALRLDVPVLTKDRRFFSPDSPVQAVW